MLLPCLSEELVFACALALQASPLCSKPVFWPNDTGQNVEVGTQADAQGTKYCFCIHILKQDDFLEMSFRKACEGHELCSDTSALDWGF